MSDFSHKCKNSKFIQLHLKNSKRFCSFQYLLNKKCYEKKHLQFQCYFHFTLVWRETRASLLEWLPIMRQKMLVLDQKSFGSYSTFTK